jgi:hypothetical protein
MKQLKIDEALTAKIKAASPDIDITAITVFGAAALNTAPIRQKHPVFFKGVHTDAYLQQMQEMLAAESRPLQIMHGSSDGDQLPVGRVFHGEISTGTGPGGTNELQTLFWVDNTHPDLIAKINSGTIDQVSVAVLAKQALSNKTGFDFMGKDVTFENVYGGVDDKGNKMGEGDAHVIIPAIEKWFEMSLVGQGGAEGAKILSSGQLKLAASHQEVPPLTLSLAISTGSGPSPTPPTPELKKDEFAMEAKDFAAIVAENAGKLALAEQAKTAAEAERDALKAQVTTLTSEVATLKGTDTAAQVTALTAEKTDLTTKLAAQKALTAKLVAPLFTQLGNPSQALPEDETGALKMVTDAIDGIKALGARLSGGMPFANGVPGRKPSQAFKRAG